MLVPDIGDVNRPEVHRVIRLVSRHPGGAVRRTASADFAVAQPSARKAYRAALCPSL
jgi:hypothetical protein